MFKKVSLILALAMVMSVFAVGCSGGSDKEEAPAEDLSLQTILDKGEFVMGLDDAFPPMGFVNEKGELTGFDVELAQAVAKKMGVTVKLQPIDWSAKEMELENGNIDVIWNGYTITAERDAKVEYTKPYLNNQQVIVVAEDSTITAKADLAGKIVGAQVDSAGLAAVNADTEFAAGLAEISEYDDYLYALMDLGTDRLDAAVVDKILIGYVMQQQPGKYKILAETMGDEYYGIGCRQGEVAFREAIDKALDELFEDGTVEAISKKWFGENIVIRDVEKLTAEDLQ